MDNPRNCIFVGVGATHDKVKADGDILFATPSETMLISQGQVYINGVLRNGTIPDEEIVIIKKALLGLVEN